MASAQCSVVLRSWSTPISSTQPPARAARSYGEPMYGHSQRWCRARNSSARGPIPAAGTSGFKLRTVPGRLRNSSLIAPIVLGLERKSYGLDGVSVGIRSVPCAPTVSINASTTAGAPPFTFPNAESAEWTNRMSPARTPNRRSSLRMTAFVTLRMICSQKRFRPCLAARKYSRRLPCAQHGA